MNPQPIRNMRGWKTIYKACLREFPVWEFGLEAKEIAAKAADTLMREQASVEASQQPEMLDTTKEVVWPKPSPKRLP